MKLNKRLLTLFAIFCVIVSAGAAFAANLGDGIYHDPDGLEPGAGLPLENQTADGPMNVTGNATTNATTNVTANVTGNTTGNATGNGTANATANATTNATHSPANANHSTTLLAAGNPIFALFALMAIIGSYRLFKRRK